jgi:XTP/dITP diphosphohydrolase
MKLLIATRNRHKLTEIAAILDWPGLELVAAPDVPGLPDVEEDGATFEANAVKKAVTLARLAGLWTLADDSGLEVDALGGRPGVMSARFAGEPVSYRANNAKLLELLAGVTNRRGRFRCVVALSDPSGQSRTVDGRCEGAITFELHGRGGFGYDPLFLPDGFTKTFAELDPAVKNRVSHRGRALQAARGAWAEMLRTAPATWPA